MTRLRARVRAAVAVLLLAACAPLAAQVAATSVAQGELRLIDTYYRTILGREPDAEGIGYWRHQSAVSRSLGAGFAETWRAMAVAFFAAPEYASGNRGDGEFLDDLYAAFLGRRADAEGHAYWAGVLQSGIAREAVMTTFLFSPEFNLRIRELFGPDDARAEVALVVDFYRGLLSRLPDVDGLRYWRTRFRAAQCAGGAAVSAEAEAISSQFIGSVEYAQRARGNAEFVGDLYNAFLRRGGDLAGFQYWIGELDSGRLTREQVRAAFGRAPEFLNRVAAIVGEGCARLAHESDLLAAVSSSPNPFIAIVDLQGAHTDRIRSASFVVAPRPGTVSRPVRARQSHASLAARAHGPVAPGTYRVPVHGLYDGYVNDVTLEVAFEDGSTRTVPLAVASMPWEDPSGYYKNLSVLKARAPGSVLDYDFFYIRSSGANAPVVVLDTDGYVRWWVPGPFAEASALFSGHEFILGDQESMAMVRVGLDGTVRASPISAPGYTNFHHNIDPGKAGVLVELDGLYADGTRKIESVIMEVTPEGGIVRTWDLGEIFTQHMAAHGDDPALFVRPGIDWLHTNAAAYDPADDSIIVSGREVFVVKIDYATSAIRWIFGDPAKHWYDFPSLRAKAITLEAGGLYPVGQHAVSVTRDGLLMLFNNGRNSLNAPPGAPSGVNYPVSRVSAYAIDAARLSAREVVAFEHQGLLSPFCSSAYESGESLLVSYAIVESGTRARLVGLDDALGVAFDFELPTSGCRAAYNAHPLPFHDLVIE